jgi:hypothetical protein
LSKANATRPTDGVVLAAALRADWGLATAGTSAVAAEEEDAIAPGTLPDVAMLIGGYPPHLLFAAEPKRRVVTAGASFKVRLTRQLVQSDSPVRFLPWHAITWTRWRLHKGQGDCTHFAYTPFLYEPVLMAMHLHLDDALVGGDTRS